MYKNCNSDINNDGRLNNEKLFNLFFHSLSLENDLVRSTNIINSIKFKT